MNNMLRKLLVVMLLVMAACTSYVWAQELPLFSTLIPMARAEDTVIIPRAPIIEWRYKNIDGKIYRRQYNCTTQEWIGEWELVQ